MASTAVWLTVRPSFLFSDAFVNFSVADEVGLSSAYLNRDVFGHWLPGRRLLDWALGSLEPVSWLLVITPVPEPRSAVVVATASLTSEQIDDMTWYSTDSAGIVRLAAEGVDGPVRRLLQIHGRPGPEFAGLRVFAGPGPGHGGDGTGYRQTGRPHRSLDAGDRAGGCLHHRAQDRRDGSAVPEMSHDQHA